MKLVTERKDGVLVMYGSGAQLARLANLFESEGRKCVLRERADGESLKLFVF